jgi:ketosteroid isomerase-like protein
MGRRQKGDRHVTITLEQMEAESEIRTVLARYCQAIDRNDHDQVRSCYHENAVTEHMTYAGSVTGYLQTVKANQYRMRFHHLGLPLIDIAGDVAHVETPHTASHIVRRDEGGPERAWILWLRYEDRFEKRNGEWRIAHRVVHFAGDLMLPVAETLIPPGKQENP